MKQALMIRVVAENYNQWRAVHNEGKEARKEYGLSDGPVYKDETNPNAALVQLNAEDAQKGLGWFSDDRFKAGGARTGKVSVEMWIATQQPLG